MAKLRTFQENQFERIKEFDINGNKYYVGNGILKIGNEAIPLSEFTDYDLSNEVHNFYGGMNLSLYAKNRANNLTFSVSGVEWAFTSKNTNNRRDYYKEQLIALLNALYPYLMTNFIKDKIDKIREGKRPKVARIRFLEDGVFMRPRTSYWLMSVFVEYEYAQIITKREGIGLFGGKGHAYPMYLINHKTNEKHKYSYSPSSIPTSGEVQKAQNLLNYIQKNGLTY